MMYFEKIERYRTHDVTRDLVNYHPAEEPCNLLAIYWQFTGKKRYGKKIPIISATLARLCIPKTSCDFTSHVKTRFCLRFHVTCIKLCIVCSV